MTAVPVSEEGMGSAVNDTIRELSGTLGVGIMGSLQAGAYTTGLTDALRGSYLPPGHPWRIQGIRDGCRIHFRLPAGHPAQIAGWLGRIRDDDPHLIASSIWVSIHGFIQFELRSAQPRTRGRERVDRSYEYLLDLLIRGIRR